VSVFTIAKSAALVFTLFLSFVAGSQHCSVALVLAVLCVVAGVIMCSVKPVGADATGLACALGASACAAVRWVSTEAYFSRGPRAGVPPRPLMLIALLTPWAAAVMVPMVVQEAISPEVATIAQDGDRNDVAVLLAATLGGATLAFAMLMAELTLVAMTSALSLNVIGHLKDVAVILLSIPVFNETLSPVNSAGVVVTLLAAAFYSRLKTQGAVVVRTPTGTGLNQQRGLEQAAVPHKPPDGRPVFDERSWWTRFWEGSAASAAYAPVPVPGHGKSSLEAAEEGHLSNGHHHHHQHTSRGSDSGEIDLDSSSDEEGHVPLRQREAPAPATAASGADSNVSLSPTAVAINVGLGTPIEMGLGSTTASSHVLTSPPTVAVPSSSSTTAALKRAASVRRRSLPPAEAAADLEGFKVDNT
jgi:drug/metabolite transporter (DMT)-like permease